MISMLLLLQAPSVFDAGKVSFSVHAHGWEHNYKIMTYSLMPNESFEMTFHHVPDKSKISVRHPDGTLESLSGHRWVWPGSGTAGVHPFAVLLDHQQMVINLIVMVPLKIDSKGTMQGYRIGKYPDIPLKGLGIYKPPRGLIRVDPEMLVLPLSPHFTLGQFMCKQAGDYPKFLLVRTGLLIKLEYLLELVNHKGFATDTFYVMSGFRTPYYNDAIGNVRYSRHQWGGAADIFIDSNPKDGVMDDLNRDGVIDVRDAAVLYRLFDDESFKDGYKPMIGGLGQYKKTSSHGPFVHVDVRGFRARWGH